MARCGHRRVHGVLGHGGPPIGGEHLEIAAGLGRHVVRFVQDGADERPRFDADCLCFRHYCAVDGVAAALVTAVEQQLGRLAVAQELGEDRSSRPLKQVEPATDRLQILAEARQRMVQPPAGGAAERPEAVARIFVDIDAEHGAARLGGRVEGWMIGEPQVVPEPDERRRLGLAHARASTRRSAAV